jgi:hypothetical protein
MSNKTPVPLSDIVARAKPNCPRCMGRGTQTFLKAGVEAAAQPQVLPCRCALKRFVNTNRSRLAVDKENRLFYRAPEPQGTSND